MVAALRCGAASATAAPAAAVVAVIAVSLSVALADPTGGAAVAAVWPAFVLVAALLILGGLAHSEGLFDLVAGIGARLPLGGTGLFAVSAALVMVVTTFLNLDTAVVFVTPVLIVTARLRGLDPQPFAYLAVFGANAGSLLLPGANLTNLIVLGEPGGSGMAFMERMWPAALAAPVATALVLAATQWRRLRRRSTPQNATSRGRRTASTTIASVVICAILVVALEHPALPVLGVAAICAAAAMRRGTTTLGAVVTGMSLPALCGLFAAAVLVGWLARNLPATALATAGIAESAGLAALGSILVNNLPAAAWFSAQPHAQPEAILVGLNVGPNLAVTGSLSALLWWHAAKRSGVRPSVVRYTLLGVLCGCAGIAAALGSLAAWQALA